ncbi:dihydrolipoyl dehydrogenase family protein [Hyphococcus sp.]|uniref:dihydrolipoyl dehydrogenase family protein n=1 Tax=Hyphococcus sp. TaxID=2038636 RepID=UPI003D0CF4CD
MIEKDLVVIGVGMAGNTAANKCASAGWSVAVIDELPYGGTCALRGCDPKKILRRGAEIIDAARLMGGKGVDENGLTINWPDLMAHKRAFTDKMPPRIESGLEKNGVETLHGAARFVNENTIELEGGERLQAKKFLIATGATPRPIEEPGNEHLIDSTGFLELENLPKRILFVGGGYVSFEFAHIARRAGSEVVIIDRGSRQLEQFDPDLVNRLAARSREIGIEIVNEAELIAIEKIAAGFNVSARRKGERRQWSVDLVVHGAGRIPAIDSLDLDAAGVEYGAKGVTVSDHLQSTSNENVYAAGDVAATRGAPLTPVAVFEGKVAASNMLKGNKATPDYRGVPSAVFTIPELVRVGMLESEASEAGHDVRVAFTDTSKWYSNFRIGETCAAAKVLIDKETDEIIGAHMIGPEYGELINHFGLAMRLGLKSRDFKQMVSAYPSVSADLGSML